MKSLAIFIVMVSIYNAQASIEYVESEQNRATPQEIASNRACFEELAAETIDSIERGRFPRHCGIRFPNNACTSCPYLGICLDQPKAYANLIRGGGNSLDWVHELDY